MPKKETLLGSEIKSICAIMRIDDGTNATVDYMEQLSWLLFLKIFEDFEKEQEEMALLEGSERLPLNLVSALILPKRPITFNYSQT